MPELRTLHSTFDRQVCNKLHFILSIDPSPLGDKVSILTHTYPHKPLIKINQVTICDHQDDSHFMCSLMSDLAICKFKESIVIHDTECTY